MTSSNSFDVVTVGGGMGASALADGHEKTYVNRALAFYRKLAGVKPDLETPPDEGTERGGSSGGTVLALSAAHSASRQ